MLRTCMSTVRWLRNRSCAISRFVRPTATSRMTSRSRRESPARRVGLGAHPELRGDGLAELGHRLRGGGRQRPGAELARAAVGVAQPLQRELALAGGGQRDAGAQLDLGALERRVELPVQLERARELLGRRDRVALHQRGLGDRRGERGERVRVARGGGDAGERLGAGVRARAVAALRVEGRRPAQPARARSGGRRSRASARARRRSARRPPPRRPPRRRRGRARPSCRWSCCSGPAASRRRATS